VDTAALTGLLRLFSKLFLEIRISAAYSVFEGFIFSRMKYSARGFHLNKNGLRREAKTPTKYIFQQNNLKTISNVGMFLNISFQHYQ